MSNSDKGGDPRWDVLADLFRRALDLDPAQREAFVRSESASDEALAVEVLAMLAAEGDGRQLPLEGLISDRSFAGTADPYSLPSGSDRVGEVVGAFRLVERIGQGGMSDVYRATRNDGAFEQMVAVKLLRWGPRGPDAHRRFRLERQVLARLNHPNIARLLDGGATPSGDPYLVMELVDGVPITEYCDRERLTIHQRLRLFIDVCSAVRYAHANLVVHRDLKPSNVLVSDAGEVRLLDFGIAKLLGFDSEATQAGDRLLTPRYAAPEQITGGAITTATDVYGLGLVLYELLVGQHPFVLGESVSMREIEEAILSGTVPPLYRALRSDSRSDSLPPDWDEWVARTRGVPPIRLARTLSGDLDTIVRKALHLEPERRFGSAGELADDIDRFLRVLPVTARPDSMAYRTAKFVRRNGRLVAVAATLGTVALGAGISTWLQSRALRQERDRVRIEAAKATETRDFMLGLFASADPMQPGRDTLRAHQLLEEGAARARSDLADQPVVKGAMLSAVGDAFSSLQRHEVADTVLSEAVALLSEHAGLGDPETLEAMRRQASNLRRLRRTSEHVSKGLEYLRAFDESGLDVTPNMLLEQFYTSDALHEVGQLERSDSLFQVALASLESVDWGEDADIGHLILEHARRLWVTRDHGAAIVMADRAVQAEVAVHGPSHPAVGIGLNVHPPILWALGRNEDAVDAGRRAVAIFEEHYPEGHRALGSALVMLGQSLAYVGEFDEARILYARARDVYNRLEGPDHIGHGEVFRRLGHLARAEGNPLEAVEHYGEAANFYAERFGQDGLMAIEHREHVGEALMEAGRFEDAEAVLQESCSTLESERGEENQFTQECLWRLATLYETWGQPDREQSVRARIVIPDRRGASQQRR